jgi:hypothetical protein
VQKTTDVGGELRVGLTAKNFQLLHG